ncbi:hypothetical protein ACOMHN_003548 [Nucella lapillus]
MPSPPELPDRRAGGGERQGDWQAEVSAVTGPDYRPGSQSPWPSLHCRDHGLSVDESGSLEPNGAPLTTAVALRRQTGTAG